MSTFTTVAHVASEGWMETNRANVLVLKARLEAEGIQCFLQGELRGPTILKISSLDFEKAKPILIETGFYKKEFIAPDPFFKKFDTATKDVFLLKEFSMEVRLLLVIILVASIASVLIFVFTAGKKFQP